MMDESKNPDTIDGAVRVAHLVTKNIYFSIARFQNEWKLGREKARARLWDCLGEHEVGNRAFAAKRTHPRPRLPAFLKVGATCGHLLSVSPLAHSFTRNISPSNNEGAFNLSRTC